MRERRRTEALTHIDDSGRARMVNVGAKGETDRFARARAVVAMRPETLARVRDGGIQKGDVLAVAQVAGIMAAKRTSDLVPLCHPITLSGVEVRFDFPDASSIGVEASVHTTARTGVEMEALTAVMAAALAVYDMCKAMDRDMAVTFAGLMEKSGGSSGHYRRGSNGEGRA